MIGRRALALMAPLMFAAGFLSTGSATANGNGRGGVTWHRTWSEAQAAARAEGKVILAASTRAGCGLCERFRNETVPQCQAAFSQVAVGYLYDISRPESVQVDRAVRARLPGAKLMPLVGFLTPDMQWVHGFWGGRNATQFQSDIDYVRRSRPQRAVTAPAPSAAAPAAPRTSPPANARPAPANPPATQQPTAKAPTATPPANGTPQATARTAPPPAPPATGAGQTPPAAPPQAAPPAAAPAPAPAPAAPAPALPLAPPALPNDAGKMGPASGPIALAPPSMCPEVEEHCPGGICDVPTIFEGPELGCPTLPAPGSRRVAAAEPAPRVTGVPDTGAMRRAIETQTDGSPDGETVRPVAREPVARSFPPPTPARDESPAPPTGSSLGWAPGRVSSTVVRADDKTSLAEEAAASGDWCAVLRLARGSSDLRMIALERRARQWAQDELDRCLKEVLAGRTDAAITGLKQVRTAMTGEAAGVDAEHGIDAVETARDLRRLSDPNSVLARSLRRNKYDELRGTRWARLFEGA